jgi:hypothetical protein
MKTIKFALLLTLTIFMIACGKEESNNSSNGNYENFINSNDGVEFKSPSKVSLNQQVSNGQMSELLLSIDHNGTYHLRSSVPTNVDSQRKEVDGIKGEWKVNSKGLIELYKSGKKIASSNEFYQASSSSSDTLSLNFLEQVNIDIIYAVNGNNFYGNTVTYSTTPVSLYGYVTIKR